MQVLTEFQLEFERYLRFKGYFKNILNEINYLNEHENPITLDESQIDFFYSEFKKSPMSHTTELGYILKWLASITKFIGTNKLIDLSDIYVQAILYKIACNITKIDKSDDDIASLWGIDINDSEYITIGIGKMAQSLHATIERICLKKNFLIDWTNPNPSE